MACGPAATVDALIQVQICETYGKITLHAMLTRLMASAVEYDAFEPLACAGFRTILLLQDRPAVTFAVVEAGSSMRPGPPTILLDPTRNPNPMIIACHVPSDGGLLPGVILDFVPKRGLAPGDTFLDKKTTKKTFSTGFFYPAGSPYPTG